jgi:hypothetical protein
MDPQNQSPLEQLEQQGAQASVSGSSAQLQPQGQQDLSPLEQLSQQSAPQATVQAVHEPTTWLGKFGQYAEDLSQDLKDGGDRTGVGTVLQKLGARGLHNGNSEAVGDFMLSLPLGLLRNAKGASEVLGGETMKGLKDVVGGGLQAIQIPSAFAAPEAAAEGIDNEIANVASGTPKSEVAKLVSKVPGASKVAAAMTDIPADTESKLVDAIGDAAENAGFERGNADTVKDAVADLAGKYKDRAQEAYGELDANAPGFQELREKIGSLTQAYKTQQNLDPTKAQEIKTMLDDATQTMDSLLNDEQKAQWADADADWSRYKAMQRFQGKANNAAKDLTSDELTDVDALQSGARSLSNTTRKGNPVDLLNRAFGDDAEKIKSIIQQGSDMKSDAAAAKAFAKAAGLTTASVGTLGGTTYALYRALADKK